MSEEQTLKDHRTNMWYGNSTSPDAMAARDDQMKTSMKKYSDSATAHFSNSPVDHQGKTPRSRKRTADAKSEYKGGS